jgi:hypothetical protein
MGRYRGLPSFDKAIDRIAVQGDRRQTRRRRNPMTDYVDASGA